MWPCVLSCETARISTLFVAFNMGGRGGWTFSGRKVLGRERPRRFLPLVRRTEGRLENLEGRHDLTKGGVKRRGTVYKQRC